MNIPGHVRVRVCVAHTTLLLMMLPVALHAQATLPLRIGFYSSDDCKDPPNAALLHFDGRNLNGAHSAACRDAVTDVDLRTYRLRQSCPAEQQSNGALAYPTSSSRQLVLTSAESFTLSVDGHGNLPVRYRFCSTTLDGHHSF